MTWTKFSDMHSGGGVKESPYETIYIEAPQKEAEIIFYNRFGHSALRVSCTCCGEDYSVYESEPPDQSTAKEYVLVIRKEDIKSEERIGEVPESGYVWRD